MADILETIVAHKRVELVARKELRSLAAIQRALFIKGAPYWGGPEAPMKKALEASPTGIIAEFKRKSPSKGWIFPEADPLEVCPAYSEAGAAALSILTDEQFFGGDIDELYRVRREVQTPILRKDFIIDPYQLWEARDYGANAVLLIAACLTKAECESLAYEAHELNLETLLEVHTEAELDYLNDCIDMVGVNNRHLGTFHTDVATSFALAEKLPKDFVLISESGISEAATIRELRQAGYRGFLIGEALMKTGQPGETLGKLIAEVQGECCDILS